VPHPLDGIRPKAAFCSRCGYRFGGVPIQHGIIICPECGHTTRFALESPRPAPTRRPLPLRIAWYAVLSLLATIAIFGLLYWRM
jgi:hypothetical protein